MQNHNTLTEHVWKPFARFNLSGEFWTLKPDTLITTWIILGLIFIVSLYIFRCLQNENSLVRNIVLQYVKAFQELLSQSLNSCPENHLVLVCSIFTFILLCNTIQVIPWLKEPTEDLNTTFALGLVVFFYVHIHSIKAKGLKHYIMHYFEPFALMFPLHIISALSSVLSMSFRLFGNIFGGCIISSLYSGILSGSVIAQTIGLLTGINILMLLLFGIFEGIIQAFVFTMLTITYLSMAITPEDDENSSPINIIP
ncbi:MAG: F0F1 ATP synthase subunit A [Candidatus Dependentiae bacterium]|nr:F0F1 ATP synthase subunit A [Candidatus Dependentiae bacterium]